MAEFSEVMKQLARMANACKGKCDECPLDDSALCTGPWCFGGTEGIAEAERIVMQWAAENPEPKYPTWEEWLITQGVIKENPNGGVGRPMPKLFERIPADLAQKLELEPKEGT